MERIKQALEKARQERQTREATSATPGPTPTGGTRPDSRGIQYGQTQTITVDDAVLRQNRIVTGLEPGPHQLAVTLDGAGVRKTHQIELGVQQPAPEGLGRTQNQRIELLQREARAVPVAAFTCRVGGV